MRPQSRLVLRLRQAVLLLPGVVRTARLIPMAAGAGLGFLFLFQIRRRVQLDVGQLIMGLRVAAVALCLGSGFGLDDPAAETVAPAPTTLLFRRSLQVILLGSLAAGIWAGLVGYAETARLTTTAPDSPPLPVGSLTLEFGAMLFFTWAAAAAASRWVSDGMGGVAAAPTLIAFLSATLFVRRWWLLFAGLPGDARWADSHERWTVVLTVALLGLLWASFDPGRRRLRARLARGGMRPARQGALKRTAFDTSGRSAK